MRCQMAGNDPIVCYLNVRSTIVGMYVSETCLRVGPIIFEHSIFYNKIPQNWENVKSAVEGWR